MDVALHRDVANDARTRLADLLNVQTLATPAEAVALIVQLARSPQTGRPIGARLDPTHVWLHDDGSVTLSPGLLPPLSEVAALLATVLGHVDAAATMPRGLMSVVERASGRKPDFSIPSLSAFAAALAPFQPRDPAAAVSALLARLEDLRPQAPGPEDRRPEDPPAVLAAPAVLIPAEPVVPAPAAPHVPVPEAPVVPMPEPAPLRPAPVPEAAPAAPDAVAGPWQPSPWQVGGAIAAAVLAALIGSAVGRWAHDGAVRPDAPSTRSSARSMPEEAAAPLTVTASEEPVILPPPATATVRSVVESPRRIESPPTRVVPQPARLVDRRAAQADAVFSPSFAANGSAVLFHAESGSESALKRAEPDDRGELHIATIVDDGARNYHVRLSPDGKQVAFDSDRDGERGVYVADANGGSVHKVSGDGYAAVPTWSPDGRRLAFLRAEPAHPAVWNLWLLDRDTGRQARLTSFRSGQVWGGAWFGDGRRIAYSHEDRLAIHDLASGQVREFASPLKGRLVRTPAVSPDGRWIIFQVYHDGAWLLDVEREAMQRVLQDPSAEEFAWSPDGRRVAYHSQRSGGWNLWTMAAP
jgi:hypothetical protein